LPVFHCPTGSALNDAVTVVPDSDYRIKLPVFEGPLDLLLFLIRKNEIDIYDIPIVTVTHQYIETLKSMQQLDLEIAGDFFVMAATLMEIKSRMLLPKGQHAVDPNATDDDAMDPRWELVHQLLQYKKFKEAARELDDLATFQRDMLARYVSALALTESDRPLRSGDRIELWNAFNAVLRRLAEKLVVGEIRDEQITVADQMEWLLKRVQTEKSFIFSDLFSGKITLRMLVATFLAVLELTRLRKLRIRQDEAFADIVCTAVEENSLETPPINDTVTA
jgi:segregation and condensation protein A